MTEIHSLEIIPGREESAQLASEELDLFIRTIYAEAEGEPLKGMIAVGAVILNRMKSPLFPDSIQGVVYEESQFEPVRDGRLYLEADARAEEAAIKALQGQDPSKGALYFYNRETVLQRGRRDLIDWFDENTQTTIKIGHHTFAR